MNQTRKLSLFIAILLILQLGVPGWSPDHKASAATSGPLDISLYPSANMSNAPINSKLKIVFDENVRLGASTTFVHLYKTADNSLVESISATSGRISITSSNNSEVTISPTSNFLPFTEYYVLIDAGTFLNVSNGAAYAGIQSATKWKFSTSGTADTTRPQYVTRGPEGSLANVPMTASIYITFNKPVYAASGNIVLRSRDNVDNRQIPVTSASVTGSGSTQITITPDTALQPLTTYDVIISQGNFEDATGNSFAGTSWTFATAQAPVNLAAVNPFTPAANATLVPIETSLTINFDQNVYANGGKYIELRRVSDNVAVQRIQAINTSRVTVNGSTVTIRPESSLAPNTAYYVWIEPGAFSKPAPSNSEWFYGISSATVWQFTTGYGYDNSPPVIQTLAPVSGGSINNVNGTLSIAFNEEVYPSSGNIEIRQVTGNTLFRSIPITSTRVKGGGTKQLVIDATSYVSAGDPAKSFINNTRYYVTIGNRALRDGAGNYFAGISSTSGWTFTVTQDGTRPNVQSLSPATGATAVGLQQSFAALFDKPIVVGSGGVTFIPTGTNAGNATTVSGTKQIDPNNARQLLITPNSALVENTRYYINMDEGAVTDLVGNSFVGILNQYQWEFLTIGGDKTPPSLSRSEVSGSVIRLIYNEPLNANLAPSPASYYVTVAGAPRNVSATKIEGNMVTLTLASAVAYTQKVVLSYTKPANGLVQDLSGNQAESLSGVEVTNGYSNTNPTVTSGSASGNTVVLNFSEQLLSVSPYAYTQFSVTVGGTRYNPTAIWHSGNVIQLTISGTIASGQTVLVSYAPGSYALMGSSGNSVGSFSNYNPATGSGSGTGTGVDTTAPYVLYVTASGTLVTIKYNEILNPSRIPGTFQYSVLVDNAVRSINSITVAGDSVLLNLSSAVTASQTVKVSYVGSSTGVSDYRSNAAASFTGLVANSGTGTGGTGTAPALQGAIAKGAALTLTFNTTLDPSSIPATSQFLVRVKGQVRMVSSVQVIGTTAVLTLASPINVAETADVTYYGTGTTLKSATGINVGPFSNTTIANQTTLLDTLTGDYEASDGGGVAIKSTGATIMTDSSPAGVQANRYTVDQGKFVTAVTTSRDAGIASPRVAFKVPEGQNAALVAISLIPLEMASKQGNVTFAVEYGDITYELPLSTLNFSQLSRMAGGNGVSNLLLIAIDKGSNSLTSALSTALNSSKATTMSNPVHFEVMVVNGSTKEKVETFSGYVGRSMKIPSASDTTQISAVWLDPVTGTLSYVPTVFKTTNGVTTATFKRQGNSAYAIVRNSSTFTDIAKHWSKDTVEMMARKFIVEGRTVTAYDPDKPITRGEFATYIAKGLGLTGDRTAAAKFKDVNKDTAMGAYIGAAAAAGIVNGVDSSNFKPNSFITRQDMATMMMRAAKVAGMTVTLPSSENSYLQAFNDNGQISSYAKTNMAQAIYLGIINGKSSTRLSPTANATRAEGAVMIMRLLEKAELLSQ
ncbi:Ig-like domain-containing protein [Paenibacillus sp. CAU 1782]